MKVASRQHGSPASPRDWGPTAAGVHVLGATIVGAWLRISLALSSGLWRDEVQSLAISRMPTVRDLLAFLVREDSHPPLFYLVERVWVGLFGATDQAIAALGLVPGILLVPAAGWAGWRLGGRRVAVVGSWAVALAWPVVWQAGDGRPYAFLSLCTLATSVAAFGVVRRGTAGWWAAYVLGSVLLLHTHNWWLLVVAGMALAIAWTAWRSPTEHRAWVPAWLLGHGAMALLYLPWVPVLLRQGGFAGYAGYATFPLHWVVVAAVLLLATTLTLLAPTILVLVLGTWRTAAPAPGPDPSRFLALVVAVPSALAMTAWRVTDLTIPQCVAALTPLALLAIACRFGREGNPGSAPRWLAASGAFLALLGIGMWTHWSGKSNVREAARFVSTQAGAGDLVIVYPSSIGPVYQRYDVPRRRLIVFPHQEPVAPTRYGGWWGRFEDQATLAQVLETIDQARRERRTVWLVNQVRLDYSPDSTAPIGTRERFRHGVGTRLEQIRSRLRDSFGSPDPGAELGPARWARELVRVERYGVDYLPPPVGDAIR